MDSIVWGRLPANWKLGKIGSLYELRNQKVSDRDYQPLSVTKEGIVPQLDTAAKTNAHDDRKLVRKGDFAINSRSDRRGSCGVSYLDGSVSLINTVLKPRDNMNPGYYNWLFHTTRFADEFYKFGHGIVDDLWTTGWQEMKKIDIPVPSLPEQQRIADFLDSKCSEIDALTKDIEHQIETLEEYKKAVITETVTKGLDSDVPMKDSGVEWIGEIPENWDVKQVKYLSKKVEKGNGITKEQVFVDGDIECVRYGEIYSKYDNSFSSCHSHTNEKTISSPKPFGFGDILCAGTGELIEEIGKNIVYLGNNKCLAGGDIVLVKHYQEPRFLNYALNSSYSQAQKSCGKLKLKVVHISGFEIENIKLAIPNYEMQKEIADYLDSACADANSIIADKRKQLETLAEYKKSLIYEYVTGKKEVIA